MTAKRIRRALLPLGVFAMVVALHVGYRMFFPEVAPGQERWASVPSSHSSWFNLYLKSQAYYLGLSYASSAAFAAAAFRRYRERRLGADRNLALGGITLSGVLAAAGCYLVGCCGSPMLAVYVSLLGSWFVPWTGPLTLAVTLLSLAGGWYWMRRRELCSAPTQACCEGGAACDASTEGTTELRAQELSRAR